jgi:RNA polymerase sigma-70 factor (ECF subfamily)
MTRSVDDIHDELLVLRCQDGDSQALEELVARWQQRLWRQALHLTGKRDAASDVLQEVWMAIVRGIRTLDDPARFRHWAYRLVINKSVDWVRRQQRQRKLADDASGDLGECSPPATGDHAERLRRALSRLPDDCRAILSLRYFEDAQVGEIARILEVPEGTVKSRINRGRTELARLLQRIHRQVN